MSYGKCTQCGCTDNDCRQCIEKTRRPCSWVDDTHELCSACDPEDYGSEDYNASDVEYPDGDDFCPNCHIEYDAIDLEYQICHHCKHENVPANDKQKFGISMAEI